MPPTKTLFFYTITSALLFAPGFSVAQTNYDIDVEAAAFLEQDSNEFIERAVQVKLQVDRDIQDGIHWLLDAIEKERLNEGERAEYRERIARRIRNDLEAFESLRSVLNEQNGDDRGSTPLRTSIAKMIGSELHSGILEDALELLEARGEHFLQGQLMDCPTHNEITVTKTLLIYSLLEVRSQTNLREAEDIVDAVTLLYPAELPPLEDLNQFQKMALFYERGQDTMLMIPNAGFVFGGEMQGDICRGVDCSALLSYATDSSVRLSTMVMEYAWRCLKGKSFEEDDPDGEIRAAFRSNWGLREAMEEYEAVETSQQLKPGDIVVWRWDRSDSSGRAGHVVMFLEYMDNEEKTEPTVFIGIEANRKDDKSLEGIVFGQFQLNRDNAGTYILRPSQ